MVLRGLWEKFQLDQILSRLKRGRRFEFDLFSEVFLMVVGRICEPASKRRTHRNSKHYWQIKRPALHKLYRSLDILAEGKEFIEEQLFLRYRDLFNQKVDVVFYDATTLSFESVREDTLRAFGYSKQMKVNRTQVLLGLIIDQKGMPVGFDVFPGNKFEGHTLREAISKLSRRFEVERVIFVADKAMMSQGNLELLNQVGYQWVIAERAKNAARDLRQKLLSPEGYRALAYSKQGEVILKTKLIPQKEGEKVIAVWSRSRAERDRQERERMLKKAREMIQQKKIKQRLQQRGALRYVKINLKGKPELDEEKIKMEERWDGFYAIRTNVPETDESRLLDIYHQLWRIEDAFRSLKSHLRVRPIYHHQPQRIRGHLVLCFLAFVLERSLWGELKEKGLNYSEEQIRELLNEMQYSVIEIEGKKYLLRSRLRTEQRRLLRALRIKVPEHIQELEDT